MSSLIIITALHFLVAEINIYFDSCSIVCTFKSLQLLFSLDALHNIMVYYYMISHACTRYVYIILIGFLLIYILINVRISKHTANFKDITNQWLFNMTCCRIMEPQSVDFKNTYLFVYDINSR